MQIPSHIGLFLCDQVIVDRRTSKPTCVGIFDSMRCSQFPSIPKPFDVYAELTDGQGRMTIDVIISDLEIERRIAVAAGEVVFPDQLHRQQVIFRFRAVSFPRPGIYIVELFAQGQYVCHSRLRVYAGED